MKKDITFSIFYIIFILSCSSNVESDKQDYVQPKENIVFREGENTIDTILEKNNAEHIDLSQHQLFIDTSRTSSFYEIIRAWEINSSRKERAISFFHDSLRTFLSKEVIMDNFPTKLIRIWNSQDGYVLYDRCNGIEPRYEISDSEIYYYGVHETLAAIISDIKVINDLKMEIKIILPYQKSMAKSDVGAFIIERTIEKYIFKVSIKSELFNNQSYVISNKTIDNYNVIVNNCPTMKVAEYMNFKKVDIPKLNTNNKRIIDRRQTLKPGKYVYDISFTEWEGRSLGNKVEMIIKGNEVKVIYLEGNISGAMKGDLIDEGFILRHKSGKWIISTEKSSVNLNEIGGCTGGPAVIDIANKKYIMC